MRSVAVTLAAVLLVAGFSSSLAAQGAAHPSARSRAKSAAICLSQADVETVLAQAASALQQAQYTQAIAALQPIAAKGCNARVFLLLAAAQEGSGDLEGARASLEQGHQQLPLDNDIAVSLARLYLNSDKKKAAHALNQFQPTIDTPWQQMQLAVIVFLADHQLPRAQAIAESGFRQYPSLDSLLLLANTLQLEGRYKDVIALLEAKRAAYDEAAPFLVTLAQSEYDAAMYGPARADTERAIGLDGHLYAAHYLLGNLLLKQGEAEAAAGEYRVAIELSPNQPRTYYYLALALRAAHREDEEESVLSQAIALDGTYAPAHCEMGRILLNGNRLPDAVAQLELAVADNASSEQAYSLLSRAYSRLGEQDKADAAAKRLTEVRKNNHRVPADAVVEPDAARRVANP